MQTYNLVVHMESEAVFGSGESVPGYVDLEILHDEAGLPFLKSKTLKGKLREEAVNLAKRFDQMAPALGASELVSRLFGEGGATFTTLLRVSDLKVSRGVEQMLKKGLEGLFSAQDVLDSLTEIRSYTSIDQTTGRAKDQTLRQIRVLKNGLTFHSTFHAERPLSEVEEELLVASVAALRQIGAMQSKGKGKIRTELYKDGEELTPKALDSLYRKVVQS